MIDNKRSQVNFNFIQVIIFIILFGFFIVYPLIDAIFGEECKDQNLEISRLNEQIIDYQNLINEKNNKLEYTEENLDFFRNKLEKCNIELENITTSYLILNEKCEKVKENRINIIEIYDNKIILFGTIIVYYSIMISFCFSISIFLIINLFKYQIDIRLLDRKSEKKLFDIIRKFLYEHPAIFLFISLIIFLISNLF